MAGCIVWEIQLELHDGAAAGFAALMDEMGVPRADRDGAEAGYGWSWSDSGKAATIFLRHGDPQRPDIRWSADWPSAERHLAALGRDAARRLLALARPVNLVSFGPGGLEDPAGDACDRTLAPDGASRLRGKRGNRFGRKARPPMTTGQRVLAGLPFVPESALATYRWWAKLRIATSERLR
jgi:hypothetical protein